MDKHIPKHAREHAEKHAVSRFSPPQFKTPVLYLEYDPVCGRLLVASARGGFVIFHGVPIQAYIGLRFSPAPEVYLRERLIGEFSFVCSSACWPKA